jgi:threonine/homoserine/homoserine lactone efflux protein
MTFLLKGLILGFSVAAPVGPVGILCIHRTIHKSYASGIFTGLGAATADLIYGLIAGLGLSLISDFLISLKIWLQIGGLIFLFYLGIKILLKRKTASHVDKNLQKSLFKDYAATFILTVTNPLTILFFMAVFSGMGLGEMQKGSQWELLLIPGVFLGSCFWWLLLSGLSYKLKKRINGAFLRWVDYVSGFCLIAFGIGILVKLVMDLG